MSSDQAAASDPGALRNFWLSVSAVVTKELRWRMRGRRAFIILTGYVALVALLVFAVQRVMYDQAVMQANFEGGFERVEFVAGSASARIGQVIFSTILVVQMTLTMMLAPALTSGSISMEREKQTLELLITTPVSTLGMVVGKLVSSLAYVLLLILASIPLMTIVFAFGGIAPEDVVRAYVLLFAVAIGLGAVGSFLSALLKRTQVATVLSYLILSFLVIGSIVGHTFWQATAWRDDFAQQRRPPEAIFWLNPVVAVVDLGCTAIPDSLFVTCSYISTVTGEKLDTASPPFRHGELRIPARRPRSW
jgi:ABC-2 type transport system permease protein